MGGVHVPEGTLPTAHHSQRPDHHNDGGVAGACSHNAAVPDGIRQRENRVNDHDEEGPADLTPLGHTR